MTYPSHTVAKDRAERILSLPASVLWAFPTFPAPGEGQKHGGDRPLRSDEGYGCIKPAGCSFTENFRLKYPWSGHPIPHNSRTSTAKSREIQNTGPLHPPPPGPSHGEPLFLLGWKWGTLSTLLLRLSPCIHLPCHTRAMGCGRRGGRPAGGRVRGSPFHQLEQHGKGRERKERAMT